MRRWLLILALLSSVVVGSMVTAWTLAPAWVKSRLAAAGLGDVDFVVDRLSFDRLSLSDIRFGLDQEQRVARLTVHFHPTRLLSEQFLDSVLIEGADLHFVSQDDQVPRLAGVSLSAGPGRKGEFRLPGVPASMFELRDSRLEFETGVGVFQVPLTGTLTQVKAGAWKLDSRIVLRYGAARADLALAGRLEPDGAIRVRADLSGAEARLPGWPEILGQGEVTLGWDGVGRFSSNGKLNLNAADSRLNLGVQANRAESADSPLAFALDMKAVDIDLAALGSLAGMGTGLDGQASWQIRLEGALPVDSAPQWREATANGRISMEVAGGGLDGVVAGTSLGIDADLSLSGASLQAAPIAPWELTGRFIGRNSSTSFGLSGADGQSLVLTLGSDPAGGTAVGAVDFLLNHGKPWPVISGTAFGRVEGAAQEALRFELDRMQIDPVAWNSDGLEIRTQKLNAQLSGTASRVEGRANAILGISGTFAGDNRITGGEVRLQGRLTYEEGTLAFEAEDCISLKVERLDLGRVRSPHPLALCARQPDGKPLLRLAPSGASSLELTLSNQSVALLIDREPSPIELAGTLTKADLSAVLDPTSGLGKVELTTQAGRLELPEQAVAISDIELSLVQTETATVTLTRAVAQSLTNPPNFPEMSLEGKAGGRFDGTMAFELLARGRELPLELSAMGEQNFPLAVGEMSYELDRIRFSLDGIQPGDIFPAVGKLIRKARGSLALSGGLSWVAGAPVGYSQLVLSDLGFDAPGLQVRGLNTRLKRADPAVRNRFDAQEIRVDLLDIGVPLRNGVIQFHTRKAPAIRIEKIRFSWGGGMVQTEPFDLRVDRLSAEHSVVLEFNEVQLSALLELIPIDGLQGKGVLSGLVPFRIRGSEVTVDHSSIKAVAPGVLRYRPESKPGFFNQSGETQLLFKALQDFRYESLAIGLNGRTRDDLQLSISLVGANPDLYDGHPFKLNFNITGELDTIIQRSLSVATFAEKLGELMSRYFQ